MMKSQDMTAKSTTQAIIFTFRITCLYLTYNVVAYHFSEKSSHNSSS